MAVVLGSAVLGTWIWSPREPRDVQGPTLTQTRLAAPGMQPPPTAKASPLAAVQTVPAMAAAPRATKPQARPGIATVTPSSGLSSPAIDTPASLTGLDPRPSRRLLDSPYALVGGQAAHPTRLLVRFREEVPEAERHDLLASTKLKLLHRDSMVPTAAVLDTSEPAALSAALETPDDPFKRGAALEAQIRTLRDSGRFAYVEPDYELYICRTPDDEAFKDGSLWGLQNTGQQGGVAGVDVGAVEAWDITTGDPNVVVAVIDTGVRYTHQDLTEQMWRNPGELPGNGLDDDANGYVDDVFGLDAIENSGDPMDQNGHGTHVAGTIAAQANGGGRHVGVAWNVRLMACRFLNAGGGGYSSDAIKCINYAAQHGARVMNASWGGGGRSEALEEAIKRANNAGSLFVAAAGNDGRNTDLFPHYPSGYEVDNLVSVAAIDRTGGMASFSNFGALTVDLGAPGVSIYSCINGSDTAYAQLDGTSMAAPHAAGVAALVFSQFPDATPAEVRDRLLRGTVPTSSLLAQTASGGRVHAVLALAKQGSGPPIIAAQPQDLAAPLGSQASLGVGADGARPLSYEWSRNGVPLPGATRRVLGIEEVTEADAGVYRVLVSNAEGTVESEAATLSLLPPFPITTFAGMLGAPGSADGQGRAAQFNNPMGIAFDGHGNCYVADLANFVIRKVAPDRTVTTLAGSSGRWGGNDGVGSEARFGTVCGVAVDSFGRVYVADHGNSTIRIITPEGVVSTLAGKPAETGSADGPRTQARFNRPRGVALTAEGTVYVADSDNHVIRKITTDGVVSTIAGVAGHPGSSDGTGNLVQFNLPVALVLDRQGNLFVADAGNSTIRKITPGGVVSTLAGKAGSFGSVDGPLATAKFNSPQAIAIDDAGTLFVADTGDNTIRRIGLDGNVTTVAGRPGRIGTRDGDWSEAMFWWPRGVAVNAAGDVFVGDYGNHALRRLDLPLEEPRLLTEPQDVVVSDGEWAEFRVVASGAPPLSYTWFKDDEVVPSADTPVLAISAAGADQAGAYRVMVTNTLGAVTSRVARLVVLRYRPPEVVGASPEAEASGVAPDAMVSFEIRDRDTALNATTIRLWLDDREVTGEAQIAAGPGVASVHYRPGLLQGSTTYAVKVTFEDRSDPPLTVNRTWRFTTLRMPVVSPDFRTASGTGVEPGFNVRSVQSSPGWYRGNTVAAAEQQLGNPPFPAVFFSGVDIPALVNYSDNGAARGNFTASQERPDRSMREAKLVSSETTDFVSFEITAYLELAAGITRFGVNSDDGFRLTVGPTTTTNDCVVLGEFDNGRASADSQFDCFVAEAGLYAFRLVWFQGTGGADVEWFTVNRETGERTLVNDTAVAGHVKAFRERTSAPSEGVVPYTFVTLAGRAASGSADGLGRDAQFLGPEALTVDAVGNIFVADTLNHTIRRISPQLEVTTVAGSPGQPGGVDGLAGEARLHGPTGIAVDHAGILYVADRENHCIRRITPDGMVTTWAGKSGRLGSTDGPGRDALFFWPYGLAFGPDGMLYVTDAANHTIRKVTPDGVVTTHAGSARQSGYMDGPGAAARFSHLKGIAFDTAGTMYVSDWGNGKIRTVDLEGNVTTFASAPTILGGLAVATDGKLYAVGGDQVWRVTAAGATAIAGSTTESGGKDGSGLNARFSSPSGVATDPNGGLFVADAGSHTIRHVTPAVMVSTIAGVGFGSVDAVGAAARFNRPEELALDSQGNLFVADKGNNTVRRISPDGAVSTYAGRAGVPGWNNGPLGTGTLFWPSAVAVDKFGNVYVTENVGSRIRKITPAGLMSTFTQSGPDQPDGIVYSPEGFFYVVERAGGNRVYKISASGSVSVFAGSVQGYVDAQGTQAQFKFPQGVALDNEGNVYVADAVNFAVRKITPEGAVSTLAGGNIGFYDGVGRNAAFSGLTAVAVDPNNHVLVADTGNHVIRKVRPNGLVTTLAGAAQIKGSTDGLDRRARFSGPKGIAVSKEGYIYVSDTENSTIRVGIPNYIAPVITRQPQSLATTGGGVTFEVAAMSAHPVSFRWRKDGRVLHGETNATLRLDGITETEAGAYSAVAINAYGSAASAEAALVLLTPPEIVREPEDLAVLAGDPAVFQVEVKGTPPLAFRWLHAGTNLPAATAQDATLVLPQVTPQAAGAYAVIVTNNFGACTSRLATLTVNLPPAISTPLADQLVAVGTEVVLHATVAGTGPMEFAWFKDGAPLLHSDAPTLTMPNVSTADSGVYELLVTSPYGQVQSHANLTVLVPPGISVAPIGTAVLEGAEAVFAVVAEGSEPLNYQWRREGVDLPGATESKLVLASVTPSQAGSFMVVVRNAIGTTESAPVPLVVNVPPRITAQPASVTLIEGSPLALNVQAEGTPPLNYQWHKDGAPLPDAMQPVLGVDTVSTNEAGTYWVTVTSPHGTAESEHVTVTALTRPVITLEPQDQAVLAGQPVTFEAAVEGSEPLSYQWWFGDSPLADANHVLHQIPSVEPAHGGAYQLIVTNLAGAVTSRVAQLTVLLPPAITAPLADERVAVGTEVVLRAAVAGSGPMEFEWFKDGASLRRSEDSILTISNASTADSGIYELRVTSPYGETRSSANLTVLVPPSISTPPLDAAVLEGAEAVFEVVAEGSEPLSYQWRREGLDLPGATEPKLVVATVTPSQAGSYTVVVRNAIGTTESAPATLVVHVPPRITAQPTAVTLIEGSPLALNVQAEGTPPLSYQWHKDGAPLLTAADPVLVVDPVSTDAAGVYWVVVSSPHGTAESAHVTVTVLTRPVITLEPQDQEILAGQPVTFEASVRGSEPFSYQWWFGESPLADATQALHQIASVQPAHAGAYQLIVTNLAGAATSRVARLTLVYAPSITLQPQNVRVTPGEWAVFTVAVEGTPPISYQWRHRGTDLPGQVQSSLGIEAASRRDSGTYGVVVSNLHGVLISDTATLRVLVAQKLELPERKLAGGLRLRFRDGDGALADDLTGFVLQWSEALPGTEAAAWQDAPALPTVQDGFGVFEVETPPESRHRIYRIIER